VRGFFRRSRAPLSGDPVRARLFPAIAHARLSADRARARDTNT
jgi:hypothetical protein